MDKLLSLLTAIKPFVDADTFLNAQDLYLEGIIDSVDILMILDEINSAYGIDIGPAGFSRKDFRSVENIFQMIQRYTDI